MKKERLFAPSEKKENGSHRNCLTEEEYFLYRQQSVLRPSILLYRALSRQKLDPIKLEYDSRCQKGGS